MTQEEKQLLLFEELCSKFPYGLKIHVEFNGEVYDEELQIINKSAMLGDYGPVPIVNPVEDDINDGFELTNIKPYLRPMSSMTDEEQIILDSMCGGVEMVGRLSGLKMYDKAFVWLNKNMFDYRGLIPMGLALEAKDGMYKTE